jgi:tRNA pseudouridine55 synthase
MSRLDGILLVDKPEGITSAEVVRRVKRCTRAKVGHLGTLDPFAGGLLPLCLDEGTKIAPFLNQADKSYSGTIRLGTRTDSGDLTGEVVESAPVPPVPAAATVDEVAASLLGEHDQVPPMHSAIKRDGRPLYELARQGITVEREARRIRIDRLTLAWAGGDVVSFTVDCSKGTYVRVLAEDIARALGTVGHVATLRRTRFGGFRIEDAATLEAVEADPRTGLLSPSEALAGMAALTLGGDNLRRARQGFEPLLTRLKMPGDADVVKLVTANDALVAVLTRTEDGVWRYARVFAEL